jgi:alpha-1,3-mannosyltransferase
MYIVHVVRQFHPSVGGLETVVEELAAAQVVAGHRVRVVTLDRLFKSSRNEILPAREEIARVEVVRIPFVGSSRYPIAPSVIRFIRGADIVHVHGIDFFFDFLAWTKPLHRRRLVASTHGAFFHTQYAARFKRLYFFTITRFSLRWYDGVAAVSAADHDLFRRIRRGGIVCIENGVNISKYKDAGSRAPSRTILALGRFSINKRFDRSIEFVAELRRQGADWRLVIAGRPFDLDPNDFRNIARTQGVADAVEVIVGPSDAELRALMRRCSVITSASDYEGFGLSAVEGMSAGLVPVLNDIPPFRILVERTGEGLLVDFADIETAAENFLRYWQEVEADYEAHRARAMKAAGRYDWPRVSERYARLYETVCGMKTRTILGVPIRVNTRKETIDLIDAKFEHGKDTIVAFANAHALNIASRSAEFRTVLGQCVIINDGIGLDIASRILFGRAFPQNLNGTDFTPRYLRESKHGFRIFLLGGRAGIAGAAAEVLGRRFPRHRIVGAHDGYFEPRQSAELIDVIKRSGADLILVGMGNPRQELWLTQNLAATGCRMGFGVGALFDFLTGEVPRAPALVRSMRLEWIFRLAREPGRLWRRYLLGNPAFILRVMRQWLSGKGSVRVEAG